VAAVLSCGVYGWISLVHVQHNAASMSARALHHVPQQDAKAAEERIAGAFDRRDQVVWVIRCAEAPSSSPVRASSVGRIAGDSRAGVNGRRRKLFICCDGHGGDGAQRLC
jgi:hypothetical protein